MRGRAACTLLAVLGLGLPAWGQAPAADPPAPAADPPAPAEAKPASAAAEALEIRRNGIGRISAEGVVPSKQAEELLAEQVKAAAGPGGSLIAVTSAEGQTPPGWEAMVAAGLDALGALYSGQATIRPAGAELTGLAVDEAARRAAVAALGDGPWLSDIGLVPPLADPYRFTATTGEDGATYRGNAPDEATAAVLERAVDTSIGTGATGEIELARGMPSESWPDLVAAGLEALDAADAGRLEIAGQDVSLEATVENGGARARVEQKVGPGWNVRIEALDPAPAPELTVTVSPEEGLAAGGRLPESVGIGRLEDMLGEFARQGPLTADAYGDKRTWTDAIDAVAIAVPRMSAGEIRLADRSARFEGTLQPGFDAAGLSAALRATLGPDWEVTFSIVEAPPESNVSLTLVPGGVDADGILPEGLDAPRLLAPLGTVDSAGLSRGGAGDAGRWASHVEAAVRALRAFETGSAALGQGAARLHGMLKPGYEAATVRDWLADKLGAGWTVEVEARDRPGKDGDRRIDFATGTETVMHNGYWLPVERFPVSPKRCAEELDKAQRDERITFAPGSDDVKPGERLLLNRLAAVIGRCMGDGELTLDVNGHTDDRGEPLDNLVLSEQRAKAVVEALAARGVPEDRLRPIGYGPDAPIASNGSPEGREANRRIDFDWRR